MTETVLPDRLYKYSPAATTKIILTSGHMRWSSVLLFNDTHEAMLSHAELKQRLAPLVADRLRLILNRGDHPPIIRFNANREKWCKKWRPKLRHESTHADVEVEINAATTRLIKGLEERREDNRQVSEETRRMSRVVCLSACSENVTMWAQYANDHSGVVLGFDPSLDKELLTAQRIEYRAKPLGFADPEIIADWICGFRTTEDRDQHFHTIHDLLYVVKSTAWQHEREWRCITGGPAKALRKECTDLILYSHQSLRQIVFGERCSQSDRDEIFRIVEEKNMSHVEFLEAKPNQDSFGLDVIELSP